jgi:peptidoglycan/xylan/chitin deacetylase (PgdA/CDA1 family)
MRPDVLTAETFEWHMSLLKQYCTPLSLNDACDALYRGDLPENPVCVTFDDGYADNAVVAWPIMQRYGVPLSIFVSTDFLDGGIMWNDSVIEAVSYIQADEIDLSRFGLKAYATSSDSQKLSSIASIISDIKHLDPIQRSDIVSELSSSSAVTTNNLMLTTKQLQSLVKAGVEIGAHTKSHPILSKLNFNQAREEIFNGRAILEDKARTKVNYFAYPNGKPNRDYNLDHIKLVKQAGFKAALSTSPGSNSQQTNRWELARFTPWDNSELKFMTRLFLNKRQIHKSGATA